MFNSKKISIDKDLYAKLVEAAGQAGYSSVDELVSHILEKEVSQQNDQQDQQSAEEQLRGLGYLE